MYSWGWGAGMEALKSLEGGRAVKGENFKFTGREAESGQTTEQLRCPLGENEHSEYCQSLSF